MTVPIEDPIRQLIEGAMAEAQPLAAEMLEALTKRPDSPGPWTTAVACRLVALYAARSLMLGDPARSEAVAQAFEVLDADTCARHLLTGAITVNDALITGDAVAPRGPLTDEPPDPNLFNVNTWEDV